MLSKMTEHILFKFHSRCGKLKLSRLCFADDVLLLSFANESSITIIKQVLNDFEFLSGLKANISKSSIFFASVPNEINSRIMHIINFSEGCLLVRYLGFPLITKKLSSSDCQPLIDRITKRIQSWSSKWLSYAGRL
ncbi:hypothetical protein L1049_018335 [Liquidambar formosana]|uniref:Reverse transcriptase domain-containing protein n=1 Tax=Liquidambar formosana TaxID=63359 RepID=A0AAP0R9Y2_LIQFO